MVGSKHFGSLARTKQIRQGDQFRTLRRSRVRCSASGSGTPCGQVTRMRRSPRFDTKVAGANTARNHLAHHPNPPPDDRGASWPSLVLKISSTPTDKASDGPKNAAIMSYSQQNFPRRKAPAEGIFVPGRRNEIIPLALCMHAVVAAAPIPTSV